MTHKFNLPMTTIETEGHIIREGRYWNPNNKNICIVACVSIWKETPLIGDWAAYIYADESLEREVDAVQECARHGAKLREKDARYFFPDINLPYRD